MKLSSLLTDDLILWNRDISDYNTLLKVVAGQIAETFNLDEEQIIKTFVERNELKHIMLEGGFAMPHGRLQDLGDVIVAVIKNRYPIVMEDGQADMFMVLLTSSESSPTYMRTLSALATLIRDKGSALRSIKDKQDVIPFIEATGLMLDEPTKVRDIMDPLVFVANLDDTISTVVERMKKHNLIFFPVVDKDRRYLGKIDVLDILKTAYPSYYFHMNDISFLFKSRPFEELAEKQLTTKVAQVYQSDTHKWISETASVVSLGFDMLRNHWHHITVVDKDSRVVGVVSTRSILHNLMK